MFDLVLGADHNFGEFPLPPHLAMSLIVVLGYGEEVRGVTLNYLPLIFQESLSK